MKTKVLTQHENILAYIFPKINKPHTKHTYTVEKYQKQYKKPSLKFISHVQLFTDSTGSCTNRAHLVRWKQLKAKKVITL